jgi:hypothetical protein
MCFVCVVGVQCAIVVEGEAIMDPFRVQQALKIHKKAELEENNLFVARWQGLAVPPNA